MDIYRKLEYTQIIQIIHEYCNTYVGKKMATILKPSFNFEKVQSMLAETMEATRLLYQKGNPPFYILDEIEPYIKALESTQVLSAKALLDLGILLKNSRELKDYFKTEGSEDTSPLYCYFGQLYTNISIESEIFEKILDENTINDNASSKLASLRKSRRGLEQNVKDRLSSILHSSNYSKYLMEQVITIRNNRYVIPVKQEYRSMIQGFVHDISSSGSTVYIEPTSVFDANNQIASLKIEEDIEIEKILKFLSSLFYELTEELKTNLSIIGFFDLLFAKAQYGKNNYCAEPILNKDKKISLLKARHPLIDKNVVVPVNISLGDSYQALIITGPNTGGKTVLLKTLGLLLLMAYSGIPIPCSEASSICVLDNIFVDIGDEQNIVESLSTFSSHMLNIVQITKHFTDNSLILLDELGSGTDPIEGANLAISILEYFARFGTLIACTTHYQELKEFALVTDNFENASFEFDIENLKPTYNLLVGVAGKSNAFEISKRLGLPDSIINRARSFINKEHVSIEELLKSIYDDKLEIENAKKETLNNLNQIEVLKSSLEQESSSLLNKKQKIIEDAKLEARDILFSAKDEANEIIRKLNIENLDIKHANQLRNRLNDKIKDLPSSDIESDVYENNNFRPISKDDIHEGLEVWISNLKSSGIVLSKTANKNNEVLVQAGLAKMNVKLKNLGFVNSSKDTNNLNHGKVTTPQNSKAKFVSTEINVIGQNVDEAIYVIDKYLDNCSMAGISPVRIVHGKGTGKLREGIHNFLKKNQHVKSFRIGSFGEGEMGVTVVELK